MYLHSRELSICANLQNYRGEGSFYHDSKVTFELVLQKTMKQIIGRTDVADFPELDMEDIRVKIDTGARTSAIHANRIRIVEKDGEQLLKCSVLHSRKTFTFREFDKRKVKSSNGHIEERFLVKTKVKLFGKIFKTEFTLTTRKDMTFPVLLGRRLLRNRFIVDVSQRDLSYILKQTPSKK